MINRIIEIIIEIEGATEVDIDELADELEGTAEILCPDAYRVSAYVGRDEEI